MATIPKIDPYYRKAIFEYVKFHLSDFPKKGTKHYKYFREKNSISSKETIINQEIKITSLSHK